MIFIYKISIIQTLRCSSFGVDPLGLGFKGIFYTQSISFIFVLIISLTELSLISQNIFNLSLHLLDLILFFEIHLNCLNLISDLLVKLLSLSGNISISNSSIDFISQSLKEVIGITIISSPYLDEELLNTKDGLIQFISVHIFIP